MQTRRASRPQTCENHVALPDSERCEHLVEGGSCSLTDEHMCLEWLRAKRPIYKDEVYEGKDRYYTIEGGKPVFISSFIIEPKRVIQTEDGEFLDADLRTTRGRLFRDVRFPPKAWNGRASFLKTLEMPLLWTGTNNHIQGVKRLVASHPVPRYRGVTTLGYQTHRDLPIWVGPDGVLSAVGTEPASDVSFVETGDSLSERARFPLDVEEDVVASTAELVLPNLLRLNKPEVMLPIIGWFFATPLKPRILDALGRFPLLYVWGDTGSGKTGLIRNIFWPLFGVSPDSAYDAAMRESELLRELAATTSVPLYIDYHDDDLSRAQRHRLHQHLGRLNTGVSRGKSGQVHKLQAPVCLVGTIPPSQSELAGLLVTANPKRGALMRNKSYTNAYDTLWKAQLPALTAAIIRFLLGRDLEKDLALAGGIVEKELAHRSVPSCIRDNLVVPVLGLIHFYTFAESLGIQLPELNIRAFVKAQCADLLEIGGTTVKKGADTMSRPKP